MKIRVIVFILILVLVAACSPQSAQPTAVPPTVTPSEVPATNTPLPPTSTLPPTWTPVPTADAGQVDSSAVQSEQAATPDTGVTPVTGSDGGVIQSIRPTITPLAACDTFGEDTARNQRSFTVGAPVQVAWKPVSGAQEYRVQLFNAAGTELKLDFTTETTYTFTADLFENGTVYGWQVTPLDPYSVQMCTSFGMELFPNP